VPAGLLNPLQVHVVVPLDPQTLMKYRIVDRGDRSTPCFGVNACHERMGGTICVGDRVRVCARGELVR